MASIAERQSFEASPKPGKTGFDSASTVVAGGRGWRRLGLLAIVLGAMALRLSAVGYGRDSLVFHVDEAHNLRVALGLSWTHLDPREFLYPGLLFYLLFVLNWGVFWVAKHFGVSSDWDTFRQLLTTNPVPFFLLGRTLSVAAGTATVGGVYLLGRRLFSPACGLLAAAFLGGTLLHVRDSALATTDVVMSGGVVLALLGAAAIFQQGRGRDYALAGLGAGLATAIKYNAVLVLVALVVAHGLRTAWRREATWRILSAPQLLRAVFLAGLTFLVLNPYVLLDWRRAAEDMAWQVRHAREGQCINTCLDVGPGWVYHLTISLRYGMGVALLGLALLGMGVTVRRRVAKGWVLLSFAVTYFAIMGSARLVFVRYMTPLVPVLCIFAALAVLDLAAWLRWPSWRPWVVAALAVGAMVEPLEATAAHIKLTRREDTRIEVHRFIETQKLPWDQIASYGPSEVWRVTVPSFLPAMAVKSEGETWSQVLAVQKTHGIHYLLAHHSSLDVFSPEIPELATALRRSATLLREFSPYEAGVTPHPVYDRVDPHYFPIGRFLGVRRSGPLVQLYRLD